jgi:GNAT superfamily N-acetyltransferase
MSQRRENIHIRAMQPEEVQTVSVFIQRVFHEFVAPDLLPGGVEHFLSHITPGALVARLAEGELILLAELTGDSGGAQVLTGVTAIRKGPHISLLFVAPEHQGRGIARRLLDAGIAQCRQTGPQNPRITVNSSIYAFEIYKRLGFEQTKEEQQLNGIRFIPMAKKLNLP